jgi:competence ComEA-like helix-hairpin-helix protein
MSNKVETPNELPPESGEDEPEALSWFGHLFAAVVLCLVMMWVISDVKGVKAEPHAESALIDINSASLDQLNSLPGIGPAMAEAIVKERQFSSVGDLTRVHGIGDKTFQRLHSLIQASQVPADTEKR